MATTCSLLSRFRAICTPTSRPFAYRTFSIRTCPIPQLRPLVSVSEGLRLVIDRRGVAGRCFSTRSTTSSIQDPSPNWSNRPPKETILLDGCDFEHWLVVVEKPDEKLTRDEIIDSYIKTLAQVVG
ncbi:multiple organellar RNA editing factor 8, chloroplastic/mitochondrial-like, partial [Phalaenopsis equestris]